MGSWFASLTACNIAHKLQSSTKKSANTPATIADYAKDILKESYENTKGYELSERLFTLHMQYLSVSTM